MAVPIAQPLVVALVHNYYQRAGGEDVVFNAEADLLEQHGHRVLRYTLDNDAVTARSRPALARATMWNSAAHRDLQRLLGGAGVDVVHLHNTFPLVSPAAYYAARAAGATVVQTLHNFRLACPSASLFRDGHFCDSCVGRAAAWPGVVHGCYRGSRAATAVTATMVAAHRLAGTWARAVDMYVAPSDFARRIFLEHGLEADRVMVKPNFLAADPGVGDHAGRYALYAGRLTEAKGVATLLDAWARIEPAGHALHIAGDGPLAGRTADTAGAHWLGQRPQADVVAAMRSATVLAFPSQAPETFGLTVAEAFATGLPVIASAVGAAGEIVEDGVTGVLVPPDDPEALAGALRWAFQHPSEIAAMGARARAVYLQRYAAGVAYDNLLRIYRAAAARAAASRAS